MLVKKWRQRILVLGCLALLSLPGALFAERIDPFVATVPVVDQSEKERRLALREAQRQVFVKLTGQRLLVDDLLSGRGLLLQEQQLRYVELPGPMPTDPPVPAIEVRFDANAVFDAANQIGLPIWPLERDTTLVWVAIDDGVQRELLGAGLDHSAWQDVLVTTANARGLPLVLPLMDLEDRRNVSFSDVWAGFDDQVVRASERYGAGYVLMGRVYRYGSTWRGRWQLRSEHPLDRWEETGSDLESLLTAGVDGAVERLGQRLALFSLSANENLTIRILDVQGVDQYARVVRYLEGLSVVDSVDPIRVAPTLVDLQLVSGAGRDAIAQAIGIERVLESVEPDPFDRGETMLQYRLLR